MTRYRYTHVRLDSVVATRSPLQLERPVFEPSGGELVARNAHARGKRRRRRRCPSVGAVGILPVSSVRRIARVPLHPLRILSRSSRGVARGHLLDQPRGLCHGARPPGRSRDLPREDLHGTRRASRLSVRQACGCALPEPDVEPSLNSGLLTLLHALAVPLVPELRGVGCGNGGQRVVGKRPENARLACRRLVPGRKKRKNTRPRVPARVFVAPRARARKGPRRTTRPGLREIRARRSRPPKGRPPCVAL